MAKMILKNYFYKIRNRGDGLELEIWGRSNNRSSAVLIRTLPTADVLNSLLLDYDCAKLISVQIETGVSQVLKQKGLLK